MFYCCCFNEFLTDFLFLQNSKLEADKTQNLSNSFVSIHKRVGLLHDDSEGGFKPNFSSEHSIEEVNNINARSLPNQV